MSDPSDSRPPPTTNTASSDTKSKSDTSDAENQTITSASVGFDARTNHNEDHPAGGVIFGWTTSIPNAVLQGQQDRPTEATVSNPITFEFRQGTVNGRYVLTPILNQIPVLVLALVSLHSRLSASPKSFTSAFHDSQSSTQPYRHTAAVSFTTPGFGNASIASIHPSMPELTTIFLDTGESLRIQTDLLTNTSRYFQSMYRYSNAWPESRHGIVNFEGIDLATFNVFQYWLRTGSIEDTDTLVPEFFLPMRPDGTFPYKPPKLRSVLVGNKSTVYLSPIKADKIDQLVQCWLLADYIEAPAFQNDIMDAIINEYAEIYSDNFAIPLYNILFLCKNTASGAPLRELVVDAVYSCLSPKTFRKSIEFKQISKDLALSVALLGMGGASLPADYEFPPWHRSFCTYHVHPAEPFNSPCLDPFTWNGRVQESWLTWDTAGNWDTANQW